MMKRIVFVGLVLLGLLVRANATELPNIIVILADDLGYGDVVAYNPDSSIPTPQMDRIAAEGMRFTDAHTPSSVCTPTRYGLLTGRYAWRTSLKRGVLNGFSPHLIDPARTTMADLFKQAGYQTACIGKWHLGMDLPIIKGREIDWSKPVRNGPTKYGFDTFYGIPASLDFPPYVYIENDRFTQLEAEEQPALVFPNYQRSGPRAPDFSHVDCLDHLAERATDWIAGAAESPEPFFLYVPITAPHKPVLPHPRFRGKSGLGDYGDFILQVDWTVGQFLETLDRLEIAEDTLIIMTSDNGSFMRRFGDRCHVEDLSVQGYKPSRHRANGPLRGTKADIWEAGHRVPFLVRWPEGIEAGTTTDATICLTDLFATFADLIMLDYDRAGAGEDSFSFLPVLRGQEDFEREPVIHHSVAGMFAIRDGDWKLVLGNGSGGRARPKGKNFQGPYALFNLKTDLAEANDLAGEHPERVEELIQKFDSIHQRTEPAVVHPPH